MTDRAYEIRSQGHEFTIPFSIFVGFYNDPVAAAKANGDEVPPDVDMYAATFTSEDPDDPEDATIYFPQNPGSHVIAHEVVHAVHGIYSRRGLVTPSFSDPIEDQEAFAHTVGDMVGLIVEARDEGTD